MNYSGCVFQNCHWLVQTQKEPHTATPVLGLREVPKGRTQSQCVSFLWAASKTGTTHRFTDVEVGLKPSQGNMCSLAGVEEVVAFAPKHSSVRNVGQDRRSAGSQPLKSSVDAHRILNSEHKCTPLYMHVFWEGIYWNNPWNNAHLLSVSR